MGRGCVMSWFNVKLSEDRQVSLSFSLWCSQGSYFARVSPKLHPRNVIASTIPNLSPTKPSRRLFAQFGYKLSALVFADSRNELNAFINHESQVWRIATCYGVLDNIKVEPQEIGLDQPKSSLTKRPRLRLLFSSIGKVPRHTTTTLNWAIR